MMLETAPSLLLHCGLPRGVLFCCGGDFEETDSAPGEGGRWGTAQRLFTFSVGKGNAGSLTLGCRRLHRVFLRCGRPAWSLISAVGWALCDCVESNSMLWNNNSESDLSVTLSKMGMFAETAIVDYCVSFADKKNKVPFSVSVCSKRTKVLRFRFPLQKTSLSCHFLFVEFWKHGDMDMETWRETWRWRHRNMEP
jgi:hypothetical protein